MNDDFTLAIQKNYDQIAAKYTRHIFDELRHKPLDRELLDRFAAEIGGRGEVCDMGCGPGHVARYLRDAGLSVFGLDLSPGMLEQARKLNPDIPFRQGNMLCLDIPDGSLAGIAAFYATVNLPTESLPLVFREMERVLRPGGLFLLAFHAGDDIVHVDELWDQQVSMDFLFFQPPKIKLCLEAEGFVVEEIIEREPYPEVEYQSRRAYILARKPAA